jgi:hypothetical protein
MKQVTTNQILNKVGHCLYRSEKLKIYYTILKRSGNQIKRSLKTTDMALAKHRLSELQDKASRLCTGETAKITFAELGEHWVQVVSASMKPSSFRRQGQIVKSLDGFFGQICLSAELQRRTLKDERRKEARTHRREHSIMSGNRLSAFWIMPCGMV